MVSPVGEAYFMRKIKYPKKDENEHKTINLINNEFSN